MKNRITDNNISSLKANQIFVFGSNAQGNHAGGAAKLAAEKFGAKHGVARGLSGKTYAIDTMSGFEVIKEQIEPFIHFARLNNSKRFLVTEIGCGIAGFKPEQIAPLFKDAIEVKNIHLPESFWNILNHQTTIKGYKVFNPDFACRGFQFEENKEFKIEGKISICNRGFHFCTKAQDCFRYYDFNPENIVCEVEALGDTQTHDEDSKVCTNHIRIGKRLSWQEVLVVANAGSNNTGHSNSGNRNSGDSNSGDRNSGDSNSGDSNSGYSNSGDSNSGYSNSGDSNSGYRNSGYRNSGNWNSGYSNSGNRNSGDSNSGDRNSGDSNSGDSNSGNCNSGDSNSGYSNSGNWNSGNRNSGDSNSGYRNSGAFCTADNPILYLFNKPSSLTVREWEEHPACKLMYRIENTIWIPGYAMSDEEKKANPKWETTEGYLKTIPMKEAWQNFWHNLNDDSKKLFTSLENFDANIFYEITGLKIF